MCQSVYAGVRRRACFTTMSPSSPLVADDAFLFFCTASRTEWRISGYILTGGVRCCRSVRRSVGSERVVWKMADSNEMPFAVVGRYVDPRNDVGLLDGGI